MVSRASRAPSGSAASPTPRARARRPVGLKADQQPLGAAEFARRHRHRRSAVERAELARVARAQHFGRAERRAPRRSRIDNLAHVGIEHLRRGVLNRHAQTQPARRRRRTPRAPASRPARHRRRPGRRHWPLEQHGAVAGQRGQHEPRRRCVAPRSPGTRVAGSQTNVTRVLPPSPRDMPNHGRISGLACGAGSSGAGTFGSFDSREQRRAHRLVRRRRPSTPCARGASRRAASTRTSTPRNFPSSGRAERYVSR